MGEERPSASTSAGENQPRRNRPAVRVIQGGSSARLQIALISFFAWVLRPVGHRGLGQLIHWMARFFSLQNAVIVSNGSWKFKLYLCDRYWARWLVDGFTYEDEIAKVLDRVLTRTSLFIDCGANSGYWSAYAALLIGVKDRVVAIEAGAMNFSRLCENRELNDYAFRVVRKAIYSRSNLVLPFRTHPIRHGSNTCVFDAAEIRPGGYTVESVESITIDDVFDEIPSSNRVGEVIIKIDVERAEIDALEGAARLIANGALIIYEDHGNDLTCYITDHILKAYGLTVYFLHRDDRVISHVKDIRQLAQLKKRSHRGYNLAAGHNHSPALARLISAVQAERKEKTADHAADNTRR